MRKNLAETSGPEHMTERDAGSEKQGISAMCELKQVESAEALPPSFMQS